MDCTNQERIFCDDDCVTVPKGFEMINNFISSEEASLLLDEINKNSWEWEGFLTKRRVQRHDCFRQVRVESDSSDNAVLPSTFNVLIQKLLSTSDHLNPPREIIVEELCHRDIPTATPEEKLTTFESSIHAACQCQHRNVKSSTIDGCESCYIAQLCLMADGVQALHLPEERHPECWNVVDHTVVKMKQNALCLKRKDCLWNWRCNIAPAARCGNTQKIILIKFVGLNIASTMESVIPDLKANLHHADLLSDRFLGTDGDDAASEHKSDAIGTDILPDVPLSEMLTIVVTTSPIRSHPSTELLERVMGTFGLAGEEFARRCPKLIVCDGCRIIEEEEAKAEKNGLPNDKNNPVITRKHVNVKQALRNGIATSDQAENYRLFKEALREKCLANVSPFFNTTVVELQSRHGYGFALRHALRNNVTTLYVCVIQHDRTFMRPTPIQQVVNAMQAASSKIKYVGITMRSNLAYGDIFQSKYGKSSNAELGRLILRPPELLLPADLWGPNGHSIENMEYSSKKIQANIESLAANYQKGGQARFQQKWLEQNPTPDGLHQLTLTPTVFWYDNTHICETSFYRDFIFNSKYKMVAKGGFVEDKLSPVIVKSIERLGLAEGHAKFGCYLLDDHTGKFFTGHMDGGAYLTADQRIQMQQEQQKQQEN